MIGRAHRRHHYVPQWYQRRFILDDSKEKKFYYLDLYPEKIKGTNKNRKDVLYWGPEKCFVSEDLYTVRFGESENVDIEKFFFGEIDRRAKKALDYFTNFIHPSANEEFFYDFLGYLSIQKLRTPKGLEWLSQLSRFKNQNLNLLLMQHLQNLHCAIWTECVWQIADASQSGTKFIISDHPVTVYNRGCFPLSQWCKGCNDPDITLVGTHTLFPMSLNKIMIFTNLSWIRNPYQSEKKQRPNPTPFRSAVFNFMHIQTGRFLSETEVQQINFIIKKRAFRYIAAAKKEWLYPERHLYSDHWRKFGHGYLLMPDPRGVQMGGEVVIGYKDGSSDAFSEYGHRPWQFGFRDGNREEAETRTLYAFKGEFARLFGPKRRGRSYEFGRLEKEEDDPEYHEYHLNYDKKYRERNKKSYRR